jgi:hypothetical protein
MKSLLAGNGKNGGILDLPGASVASTLRRGGALGAGGREILVVLLRTLQPPHRFHLPTPRTLISHPSNSLKPTFSKRKTLSPFRRQGFIFVAH